MKYMRILLVVSCLSFAKVQTQPDNSTEFLQKATLDEAGIMHFFKCYNDSYYVKRFLPTCFVHVTDLLSYSKDQQDPYGYTYSIIALFLNRFKSCGWTNSYALAQLLEQLPDKLASLIDRPFSDESLDRDIDDKFTALLPLLDKNRSQFIQELKISVRNQIHVVHAIKDVQSILIRFLDTVLDKLIWSPEDEMGIWKSFCVLGAQLEVLHQKGIIPDLDTLNQLLRSLVARFEYFIELCSTSLKPQWYLDVYKELKSVPFLQIKEQEPAVKSKIKTLAHALRLGHTRATAYERGIVT